MTDTALGRCRVCRGPLVWTMAEGEQWTACDACDLRQMEMFELPPLYAKGEEFDARHWEPSRERGVVLPEDGDDDGKECAVLIHVGVPLKAVLLSLWEGGPVDGS